MLTAVCGSIRCPQIDLCTLMSVVCIPSYYDRDTCIILFAVKTAEFALRSHGVAP